ncbi:hypothetical protein [Aquibacillus saliphilus]|uniref:hypothetical protein n=1 Tax=Aquibacillus saliphilus TaxID=1909422 RepID=UPI001CEFDFB6|nr:hypothetical protein [Aquibacillus saliphilus]
MKESTVIKIRSMLVYFLLLFVALLIAYTAVYTFNVKPNGYQVISQKEGAITLQTYTIFGMKENAIIYSPPENQQWKVGYLVDLVSDQKLQLLLFFATAFFSLFLFLSIVRKGDTVLYSLYKSGIIAAVIALIPYINNLDKIQSILNGS